MEYSTLSADELEFFAENELIMIEPTFTYAEQVNFIMVRTCCCAAGAGAGYCPSRQGPDSYRKLLFALCSCQGDFGPFTPGVPVFVPLWFAARLRQGGLCRIMPPEWLSVGKGTGHTGKRLPLFCRTGDAFFCFNEIIRGVTADTG
jgi:hypothetical protein